MKGLNILSIVMLIAAGMYVSSVGFTQPASNTAAENLRNRIESSGVPPRLNVGHETIYATKALPDFYERRGYRLAWSIDGRPSPQVDSLVNRIRAADQEGLRATDYHFAKAKELLEQVLGLLKSGGRPAPGLLVDMDLLFSDAFLVLGSHLLAGRLNPETIDPEWMANRREIDMATVLERALESDGIERELVGLLPPQPGYSRLKKALLKYRAVVEEGGWPVLPEGAKLEPGAMDPRVNPLRARLAATGDLTPEEDNGGQVYDEQLVEAVIRSQRRHGLDPDGIIGPNTLAALNVTAQERARQIETNLERWRWLPQDFGSRYILVNIANFELDVVENDLTVMTMRVIVGRQYRRTPVFSDRMTYLVLSPYWNVPPGIAANDVVPALRKNPGYLNSKNIKAFSGWGADAKPVDPALIDWSKVSSKAVPYRFRQDPGPSNSLGRVKFMFPNKFNVYLHDTPSTELFGKVERTFSSGCIRLEKPIELAEYLLKSDPRWPRARIEAAIQTWVEQTVTLPEHIPVHILYWTAWAEEDGTIHFRKDIYDRDKRLMEVLLRRPPSN